MNRVTGARRADATLLLLTAYWGFTFVVVKDALEHASPLVFVALRFGVGALALTPFVWRDLRHGPSVKAGLLLGLFLFLGFAFQTAGLQGTTPARSAFITGMSVLLVPVASLLLFRVRPAWTSWMGVALAAVGLFVLTGAAQPSARTWRGDALTGVCALAYALHITLTGHYSPSRRVGAMVAVQLWVVALLAVVTLPLVEHRFQPSPALWFPVLFTGIVGSALAISIQSWAQARTSSVRAALIFSLEPVFAACFSLAMGRERLGVPEAVGGALVVLAVLLAEVGGAWLQAEREPV